MAFPIRTVTELETTDEEFTQIQNAWIKAPPGAPPNLHSLTYVPLAARPRQASRTVLYAAVTTERDTDTWIDTDTDTDTDTATATDGAAPQPGGPHTDRSFTGFLCHLAALKEADKIRLEALGSRPRPSANVLVQTQALPPQPSPASTPTAVTLTLTEAKKRAAASEFPALVTGGERGDIVIDVNEPWLRACGFSASGLLGFSLAKLTGPRPCSPLGFPVGRSSGKAFADVLAACRSHLGVTVTTLRYTTRARQPVWSTVRATPITDGTGMLCVSTMTAAEEPQLAAAAAATPATHTTSITRANCNSATTNSAKSDFHIPGCIIVRHPGNTWVEPIHFPNMAYAATSSHTEPRFDPRVKPVKVNTLRRVTAI